MEDLFITHEDLKKWQPYEINRGSNGTIYRIKPGYLYKIYHSQVFLNDHKPKFYDEEGVRIFLKSDFAGGLKDYGDANYVKLCSSESIALAIKKQKDIHLTSLPLGSIYVDFRFKGCILKDYLFSKSIYFVKNFPYGYRKKMMRIILEKVKELLKHYIYPVDLGFKGYNRSNVLWNFFPFLEPVLIDLDGYSTIYSYEEVPSFYQECVYSLNCLLLEILFDYPLKEIYSPMQYEEGKMILEEYYVQPSLIDKLVYQTASLDDLTLLLKK